MFRTPEPLLPDRREKQVIVGNISLRIKKTTEENTLVFLLMAANSFGKEARL